MNRLKDSCADSLAHHALQELDLKVGVAFTRFQTRYFQGKYGERPRARIIIFVGILEARCRQAPSERPLGQWGAGAKVCWGVGRVAFKER